MKDVKILSQGNIKHNLRLARRAIELHGETGRLERQGETVSAVRLDNTGRRLTFLSEDVAPLSQ